MAVRIAVKFAIIPEWIITHPQLSGNAIRLYAVLMRHADNDTLKCHPSRKTIAEKMHCSVDTVDRIMKELIAVSAVTVSVRANDDGGQSSNDYTLEVVPPGGRESAAGGGGNGTAHPRRTGAAQTIPSLELDPSERDSVPSEREFPDQPKEPTFVFGMAVKTDSAIPDGTFVFEPPESPPPDAAPPPSPPEPWATYESVSLALGWPVTRDPVQLRKVKEMLAAGSTSGEIGACAAWLMDDPFWQAKGVDFKLVQSQLTRYRNRRNRTVGLRDQYAQSLAGLERIWGDD